MQVIKADEKKFERHNLMEKTIRGFTLPLLNNMPTPVVRRVLMKTNRDGKVVVEKGGSARSLEVLYTRRDRKLFSRGIFQGITDLYWHDCLSQSKAIRNRLKIVEERLENEILNLFYNKKQKNIKILTVAGGSARGIVGTVKEFKDNHQGCNIKIINIDRSNDAIRLGKKLAETFKVNDSFKWIRDDAQNVKNYIKDNSIDITEMVGLLDYFNDEKGIKTFSQIHSSLKDDGMLITANICPNREKPFLSKIWPKMKYRKPEDLARILSKAGFSADKIKIIEEPLKVHIIAVAKK